MPMPQRLIQINEKLQEILKDGEFMLYISKDEGACVIMNKKHEGDILKQQVTLEDHIPKVLMAVSMLNTLMKQMLIVMDSKNDVGVVDMSGRRLH